MSGRVLIVAGSDSGGGAGIQADLKTVLALGGFGMTAITALTAQNTIGVHGVHPVPEAFVRLQMQVVLDDLGADAVKTGMLGGAAMVRAVTEELRARCAGLPIVVDPVMVAKGGARLLDDDAVGAMRHELLPLATVLTPNVPEAETLTGLAIDDTDSVRRVIDALLRMGVPCVLMKGGHLPGPVVRDWLATADGTEMLERPRVATPHTHGTGCTTASAVAAGLAAGLSVSAAVHQAREYVQRAILAAPGYGAGHGPLGHGVTVDLGRLNG